jgi:outer membrane protein assembly factor BamB
MKAGKLLALVVFLVAIAGAANAQLADTPWPKAHHDLNNTGRSEYAGTHVPDVKWTFPTGGIIRSSPVIGSGGTIYFGSDDNNLYALHPNGTLKWKFTAGGAIYSTPALASDGTIYFVSKEDRKFWALYPNGTEKWNLTMGANQYPWSSPTIAKDGTIYVGSDDYNFYAIYPNGTIKWKITTTHWIQADAAVGSDGTVYFISYEGNAYAVYPNSTVMWKTPVTGYPRTPVIDSNGTIYVGTWYNNWLNGVFYALYPNGTIKWSISISSGGIWTEAAIASDGTVLFGTTDGGWTNGRLYAVYPNGTIKWINSSIGGVARITIDKNDIAYVGTGDNNLYAFYPNGTLKWKFTTGDRINSKAAIDKDGTIYFGSFDGKLYAIRDITPPRVAIISPQNATYPTSTIQINVSARDPSGVSSVIAEIDGSTNVTLNFSGGYYIGTTPALADGSHSIRIYANDSFGNINASEVVYFSVDTTPPRIVVAYNPSPVEYGSEANLTFNITELHPATVKIWRNDTLLYEGSYAGGVPFNVSVATNQLGWWNYTVYANDILGNANSTTVWVLVRDTKAPVIDVLYNPSPVEYGTQANITVSITEDFPDTLVILQNGSKIYQGVYGSGAAFNISVASNQLGLLNYTLIANDTSGNVNTTEILVTVRDSTPPEISIVYNPSPVELDTQANITVNVTELLPDTIRIFRNGTLVHQGSYGSGVFNISVDSSITGWWNYTAWVNDTSSNANSTTVWILVRDTTPPNIAFVAPTPANVTISDEYWLYVNITASENLSSAWLELWNASWHANISMQGSAISWHLNVSVAEGGHGYRVWANDTAGNLGVSEVRSFTRVLLAESNLTTLSANETKPVINTTQVYVEAVASNSTIVSLGVYVSSVVIGVQELSAITSAGRADRGLKYLMVENATSLENLSRMTIKLYYSKAELGGLDESTLELFYWNGSLWHGTLGYVNGNIPGGPFVYDAGRNTDERYVYAVVNHTSHWAVGGKMKQAAAAPALAGTYSPKAVVLANSIDLALAEEFINHLRRRGIKLYIVDAANFTEYSKKQYVIILGGHEALEGVGDIVAGVLSEGEKGRVLADKAYMKKRSVFRVGQVVYIFAGRNRHATAEAWREVYKEVAREIEYNWG